MTPRVRGALLTAITIVLLGAAIGYAVFAFASYQSRADAPSQVATHAATIAASGPRIVFRNTAAGQGYGMVASVPLDDPNGSRAITAIPCDRVYATRTLEMCLHTDPGVVTTFNATLHDAAGRSLNTWPLPGVPSRTRISSDSKLIAQTSFITGASYGSVGFSTQTTISRVDGSDYGNLENFTLLVDGRTVTAADRNFWGVTFASDDDTFFATAASGNQTWLVRGSLAARTLTAIRSNAECPSLSPDGTKIAYKKRQPGSGTPRWDLAVLDFGSGIETLLPIQQSVDDQAEWLTDSTLLYGMPDPGKPGDSNVYAIPADGKSPPTLFIPHAWSPSVVD